MCSDAVHPLWQLVVVLVFTLTPTVHLHLLLD